MRARRFFVLLAAVGALAGFSAIGAPAASPLPLGGSEPNWTLDGTPCQLIEVPAAAPPVGTGPCPGVRPGAIVNSDTGQCTFNFLFQGSDGRRYIGTAGHCILGESPIGGDVGEEVVGARHRPGGARRQRPAHRRVRVRDPPGPEGLRG